MCGDPECGEEERVEVLGVRGIKSGSDGVCNCTRSALIMSHVIDFLRLEF
jgi:hypothetical protein